MELEITLKNYRCFSDSKPVHIVLKSGFTSFIGINNAGKSSLLRFFYEFRDLFLRLSQPSVIKDALTGRDGAFSYLGVSDPAEVFTNTNERDIEVSLRVVSPHGPLMFRVSVRRPSNNFRLTLLVGSTEINPGQHSISPQGVLDISGGVDLSPLLAACLVASKTTYIGSFRDAINVGEGQDYFDIHVGQTFIQRWKNFKSGYTKHSNEAVYSLTRDIERIFGFDSLEINPSSDDKTLQLIVNGRSRRLSELGSGLTQFILERVMHFLRNSSVESA